MPESFLKAEKRFTDAVFYVSLLLFVGLVLWLPVFPSGDGPLHLYYSHVFWRLATDPGPYAQYYEIRHIIQPYCLHYYALIFFERFTSPANAEKLFVSLILLNAAFGFRFLTRKLGRTNPIVALWIIGLLLSWPLSGGFLNFCFATGLSFWGLAFWHSLPEKPLRSFIGFVVTLLLLLLSHPIPLLVLAAFLTVDLAIRLLENRRTSQPLLKNLGVPLLAFSLAFLAILVPVIISDKSRVASDLHGYRPQLWVFESFFLGRNLGMFAGWNPLLVIYRFGLFALAPVAVWLASRGIRQRWREHRLTAADRQMVAALLMMLGILFLPDAINGSRHLPDRMPSIAWPLALSAAAAAVPSAKTRKWLAAGSVALIAITFFLAVHILVPISRKFAVIDGAPLPTGKKGIFLAASYAGARTSITYPVFFWSGARAFERNDSILLNSPWLDQTIQPLKRKPNVGLLPDFVDLTGVEVPTTLVAELRASAALRARVFGGADFIYYVDPYKAHPDPVAEVDAILDEEQQNWNCAADKVYAICEKKPGV